MAKRELSNTLKNLKFMQRASLKEEKVKKEEEVTPAGDFPSSSAVKRCVVIFEGDPLPAATRGRMSFLNFNPSIDKLNGEASDVSENESTATNSGRQNESVSIRENKSSRHMVDNLELDASSSDANGDLKRKQAEVDSETQYPNKSRENDQDNKDSSSSRSSKKQHKREKLEWSVLRPPKYQNKTK